MSSQQYELCIPGDCLATWTSIGGPMYDIGYNPLINLMKINKGAKYI